MSAEAGVRRRPAPPPRARGWSGSSTAARQEHAAGLEQRDARLRRRRGCARSGVEQAGEHQRPEQRLVGAHRVGHAHLLARGHRPRPSRSRSAQPLVGERQRRRLRQPAAEQHVDHATPQAHVRPTPGRSRRRAAASPSAPSRRRRSRATSSIRSTSRVVSPARQVGTRQPSVLGSCSPAASAPARSVASVYSMPIRCSSRSRRSADHRRLGQLAVQVERAGDEPGPAQLDHQLGCQRQRLVGQVAGRGPSPSGSSPRCAAPAGWTTPGSPARRSSRTRAARWSSSRSPRSTPRPSARRSPTASRHRAITSVSVSSVRCWPSSVVTGSPSVARRTMISRPATLSRSKAWVGSPSAQHHVVGDVDDVRDRPHPGRRDPGLQPRRRRPDLDVGEHPARPARTQVWGVDAPRDVVVHGALAGGLRIGARRRRQIGVEHRRDLAGDAVHGQAVRPVRRDLELQHLVGRPGTRRSSGVPAARSPGSSMIPSCSWESSSSRSDRIIPSDSSAAQLRLLQHHAARQRRARQHDGDGGAGLEVAGAADDLARLALADVDRAQREPVGVRVLSRASAPCPPGRARCPPARRGRAAPRAWCPSSTAARRAPATGMSNDTYSRSHETGTLIRTAP